MGYRSEEWDVILLALAVCHDSKGANHSSSWISTSNLD